jgi:AcrR family transcriptional regulator
MRAPSLYRYFSSKNAIYDAMYLESVILLGQAVDGRPKSADPRQALRQRAQRFVRFLTSEPLRFQLIDQRPIAGWEPTRESYAVAVANVANVRQDLEAASARGDRAVDMWRALMTGLVNQQISNDPGGNRWTRLLDDAIEMYLAHFAEGRS